MVAALFCKCRDQRSASLSLAPAVVAESTKQGVQYFALRQPIFPVLVRLKFSTVAWTFIDGYTRLQAIATA